jgi:hypothetical protein
VRAVLDRIAAERRPPPAPLVDWGAEEMATEVAPKSKFANVNQKGDTTMARPALATVSPPREGEDPKRSAFRAVAETRVSKVIIALRTLPGLNKPSLYQFDRDDLDRIIGAIEAELTQVKEAFDRDPSQKRNAFTL